MARKTIMFLDSRDCSHTNSFLSIALRLKDSNVKAEEYFEPVENILFQRDIFWIKSPTYFWSNCEDWRNIVYRLLKKWFKIDLKLYCGMSFDQVEPALIYAMIADKPAFVKKIRNGLFCKLGWLGDNLEHSFLRPRVWSIIAKQAGLLPVYWVLDILEVLWPLEKYPATTRTIRDYIFLVMCQKTYTETVWTRLLKWKHRNTNWSVVFATYFCQENNKAIYEQMSYNLL